MDQRLKYKTYNFKNFEKKIQEKIFRHQARPRIIIHDAKNTIHKREI